MKEENKETSKKGSKTLKHPFLITIVSILAILVVIYIITSLSLKLITRHNDELTVPDFSGMTVAEALTIANHKHLRLEVTDSVYIRSLKRGAISRQNPDPGSHVKKNRRILLTINSIVPKQVEMPSLIGYSLRQAKTELISKGLMVGKLIYQQDMATNNVLAQKYNGVDIEPGEMVTSESPIDLVLGMNYSDNRTFIPNVTGYKYTMARDIIHDNSLNISSAKFDETVESYSDSLDAFVYRQQPAPSDSISYRMGTTVTLYLSKDQSKLEADPYGIQ